MLDESGNATSLWSADGTICYTTGQSYSTGGSLSSTVDNRLKAESDQYAGLMGANIEPWDPEAMARFIQE